jgi:dCMP deaminase
VASVKEKYLLAYMDMAERFAETSEANRLKVCAMLIKNGSILSIGINGTPSGFYTNNCEDEDGNTAWYVRHAEQACLDRMLHSNETTRDCIMLVTHQPCKFCSLRIKDAGIKEVYYRYDYRCNQGVEYLLNNGILVQKV